MSSPPGELGRLSRRTRKQTSRLGDWEVFGTTKLGEHISGPVKVRVSPNQKKKKARRQAKVVCTGCRGRDPPVSNILPDQNSDSVGWIECVTCSDWWHQACVGVTGSEGELAGREWTCSSCPPPPLDCSSQVQSLSLTQLESYPPQERLQRVGDQLFPLITNIHPGEFAGKITSILLDRSSLGQLVDIIQDEDWLREEVKLIADGLVTSPINLEDMPDLADVEKSDESDSEDEHAAADLSPPVPSQSFLPFSLSPPSAATEAGRRFRRREIFNKSSKKKAAGSGSDSVVPEGEYNGDSDEETDPVTQQRTPLRSPPPPSQLSVSGAHLLASYQVDQSQHQEKHPQHTNHASSITSDMLSSPTTHSYQASLTLPTSGPLEETNPSLSAVQAATSILSPTPVPQPRTVGPSTRRAQASDFWAEENNNPPPSTQIQQTADHAYSQAPPNGPPPSTLSQGSQDRTQQTQEVPLPQLAEVPSMEEIHTTHIPTFTWVPKAARGDFARVMAELYNKVVNNRHNIAVWSLFYMFPKCILHTSLEKNKKDNLSLSKAVKARLAMWRRGGEEYGKLWQEAIRSTRVRPQSKKKAAENQPSQEERNGSRATRLAQQGEYTRAVQSLLSSGLADHSRANVIQMQSKHPAATQESSFRPQQSDIPQQSFTADQVMKGIKSFRKGSAPGPSGLRAEHLRAATQSAPPNRRVKALEAVTRLVNIMSAGDVPKEVAPYLSGARLQAGIKKDGGIRPIAVGNLFRRLTSKCSMSGVYERAAKKLGPHQLGVGVPGGLESIIHAVNQLVAEEADEGWMLLQLDLVNAFNVCDRDSAFQAVEEEFPDIMKWVLTCYSTASFLVFGDSIIMSECGFHQGDPLASLLFSLTLHPIIEKINSDVPGLSLNEWYLDDGAVAGKKEQLQQVVDILLEHGPARGLHLSTAATVSPPGRAKSTIWLPNSDNTQTDPLDRGIPRVEEEGIILLGCPIGSPEFVRMGILDRIRKVELATDKLPLLRDAQIEYVLLRSCLSLPKMMYTLRTSDPTNYQMCWQRCDDITRDALSLILGRPMDEKQWKQAQIPTSMGGLGLSSARDHAPAAYATSVLSAQDLKLSILGREEESSPPNIQPALLTYLSDKMGEEASIESLTGVPQRAVSLTINLNNSKLLSNHINELGEVREKARLNSVGLPHSGDWLNVLPSPTLGLHIRSAEFVMSVKYRLGMPVYSTAGQCPACLHHSDALGDHAISCGYQGERIARHDSLRDALYAATQAACLGATREDRSLLPGTEARPADVMIPNWTCGKDTALDVTVVNPLQTRLVEQAANTAGHALVTAYNRKMNQAGEACRREQILFVPMPMETLGGWHEATELQVKRVASAQARHTGEELSDATRHLYQKMAVLLVKGNSALLNNRIPVFPSPEITGIL